jgi:hypothetical protein
MGNTPNKLNRQPQKTTFYTTTGILRFFASNFIRPPRVYLPKKNWEKLGKWKARGNEKECCSVIDISGKERKEKAPFKQGCYDNMTLKRTIIHWNLTQSKTLTQSAILRRGLI